MNTFGIRSRGMRVAGQALVAAFAASIATPRLHAQHIETAPAKADQPTADAKANSESCPKYLRVVENKGKSIALEIASRNFVRADGTGPKVGLVAVAHIGDKSFYKNVQKLLEGYDVVLYESVKPAGTGGAGGDTDEEKVESTKEAMQFIGGLIESEHAKTDAYPADLNALKAFAAEHDARLVKFVETALVDAWGHQLVYVLRKAAPAPAPAAAPAAEPDTYSLISLGADGKTGGEGINADLDLADQHPPDPFMLSKEDGLQSQLASALGLRFQLDALEYDKANWRCSDMAMDEVNRRLQAKGLDFGVIGGTLAGSSFPAKVVKIVLGLMKFLDSLSNGVVSDAAKVFMIELLGDETMIEQSLDQFGKGFGEVIVQDRNQVAVDDLKRLIEREPNVKSVAILYGAAHMPDMSAKLRDQLGYQELPSDQADSEHWLTAITVDYSQSAISQQDINQMRMMIKQAMRQQMRAKP